MGFLMNDTPPYVDKTCTAVLQVMSSREKWDGEVVGLTCRVLYADEPSQIGKIFTHDIRDLDMVTAEWFDKNWMINCRTAITFGKLTEEQASGLISPGPDGKPDYENGQKQPIPVNFFDMEKAVGVMKIINKQKRKKDSTGQWNDVPGEFITTVGVYYSPNDPTAKQLKAKGREYLGQKDAQPSQPAASSAPAGQAATAPAGQAATAPAEPAAAVDPAVQAAQIAAAQAAKKAQSQNMDDMVPF